MGIDQWIGSMEHLQEAIFFPIKWVLLATFPSNQRNEWSVLLASTIFRELLYVCRLESQPSPKVRNGPEDLHHRISWYPNITGATVGCFDPHERTKWFLNQQAVPVDSRFFTIKYVED